MADTKFMSFAEATANSTDSVLIGNSTNGVRRAKLENLREAIGAIAENCGGVINHSNSDKNGYVKFANGFLVQWGETTCNGAYTSFPIAFSSPIRCMTAMTTPFGSNEFGAIVMEADGYKNDQYGFGLYCYNAKTGAMDFKKVARWIAVGF